MKTYEQYIESRFDWIGNVPYHWKLGALKYVSTILKGKKAKEDYQDYAENLIPYLSMEYLRNQTESPVYVKENDESIVHVNQCDLLILWDGSKAGEIVKAKNGALSSTMGKITITDTGINKEFLAYYLKSCEPYLQSNRVGMGIPHVDGDILKNLPVFLPAVEEQIQIVRFLDNQTGIIEGLITKKEKLIEKLKEKRQAIINEAVTKGLDPNAKMKDSGIEWMGAIPIHWKVARIGHYTQLIRGASPRPAGDARFFGGNFMPWITVGEVTNGDDKYLTSTENYLTKEGSELSRIIFPETLLLSNSGATLGVPKISKITGCINDGSVAFVGFNKKLDRDFLFYFFKTHTDIYRQEMSGYGQPNLNTDIIKSTFLPLPPIEEQIKITKFIETQFVEYDNLITLSKMQLDKLRKYRQSLIAEAVTGKIDVRDWEPKN